MKKSDDVKELEIDLDEIAKPDQDDSEEEPEQSEEAKKLFSALDEYIAKNNGRATPPISHY